MEVPTIDQVNVSTGAEVSWSAKHWDGRAWCIFNVRVDEDMYIFVLCSDCAAGPSHEVEPIGWCQPFLWKESDLLLVIVSVEATSC